MAVFKAIRGLECVAKMVAGFGERDVLCFSLALDFLVERFGEQALIFAMPQVGFNVFAGEEVQFDDRFRLNFWYDALITSSAPP